MTPALPFERTRTPRLGRFGARGSCSLPDDGLDFEGHRAATRVDPHMTCEERIRGFGMDDEIKNLISYFESEVRQHDSCLAFATGNWRADPGRYRKWDLAAIADLHRRFTPFESQLEPRPNRKDFRC